MNDFILRIAGIFSHNSVIQRDMHVPVWGWAAPDSSVSISFAGARKSAKAGPDGQWFVSLDPIAASDTPQTMRVESSQDGQHLEIENMLVGDVWLCSGQSNMKMTLANTDMPKSELAKLHDPLLQVCEVPERVAATPEADTVATWQPVAPDLAGSLPAVPYHFAHALRRELNIPVGVVVSAYGHTPIEAWLDRETLARFPETQATLREWEAQLDREPYLWGQLEDNRQAILQERRDSGYNERNLAWLATARDAKKAGKPLPPAPERPSGPGDPWSPTVLFNAMIAPLVPMAMRGVIWYQGETNAIFGNAFRYRQLFPALIKAWRRRWELGNFPFLYVQLANHEDLQTEDADGKWAELREAQAMALTEPNTGMAVTIDIGETDDIHPKNKRDVGERLAGFALADTYRFKHTVKSAPRFAGFARNDGLLRISFNPRSTPIQLRKVNGETGVEIAGADRVYRPAEARVEGNTLAVWNDNVAYPVAVRYAWAADPAATLFGPGNLPIPPFRSDKWPSSPSANRRIQQ